MCADTLLHAETTAATISSFRQVYNTLGPGLLEKLYVRALRYELEKRGRHVGREVRFHVYYDGHDLGEQRLDMVVDKCVAVEAKSTAVIPEETPRRLYNYLRISGLEVGLLLHFGLERPAFRRIVLQHPAVRWQHEPGSGDDHLSPVGVVPVTSRAFPRPPHASRIEQPSRPIDARPARPHGA